MTADELYAVYAKWSGELHHYVVKHLGRHVDVEFFPGPDWAFRIYSGRAEDASIFLGSTFLGSTVPGLRRPPGERNVLVRVPGPAQNPSQADLDEAFRALCLAAARVLNMELGKAALRESNAPESRPKKSMLIPKSPPKRKRLK